MKILKLHPWDVTPAQARRIQDTLRRRVTLYTAITRLTTVAGADIALDPHTHEAYGGVIVYTFPALTELERRSHRQRITFPYIPGLLAFREAPVLLEIFRTLVHPPDLILVDGHGLAHPRGLGIATHLGLLLDTPTIGCAKSRLIGTYQEPGPRAGERTPLRWRDAVIGAVVRTRDRVQPMFVSIGHQVDLDTAVTRVLQCGDGYRIPKPTREADRFVAQVKRGTPPHTAPTTRLRR